MPIFVFLLVFIVVQSATLQHGRAVLAAGVSPRKVRSRLHATLNIAALVGSFALLPTTVVWHTWLYLLLAPTGFAIGLRNMAYASRASATTAECQREFSFSLVGACVVLTILLAALYF